VSRGECKEWIRGLRIKRPLVEVKRNEFNSFEELKKGIRSSSQGIKNDWETMENVEGG